MVLESLLSSGTMKPEMTIFSFWMAGLSGAFFQAFCSLRRAAMARGSLSDMPLKFSDLKSRRGSQSLGIRTSQSIGR